MITNVSIRLRENDKTVSWLCEELQFRGYKISRTELSKALSGSLTTPKAERILVASNTVIEEYEKEQLDRLIKRHREGI